MLWKDISLRALKLETDRKALIKVQTLYKKYLLDFERYYSGALSFSSIINGVGQASTDGNRTPDPPPRKKHKKTRVGSYYHFAFYTLNYLSMGYHNRVRYFRRRVPNFNQSDARKQCFLASDWLKLRFFPENSLLYRVRNFRGRVSNFNQSEARKHCFLASDWLKFETLPRKFRTLLICLIYAFKRG